MQAVPLRHRGRTGTARWLLHGAVIGSFVPLLLGMISPAGGNGSGLVRDIRSGFSIPESSGRLLEWLPARIPAHTAAPRDPSPPRTALFTGPVLPLPGPGAPSFSMALPTWVQTHREAGLFSGPADETQRFTILPQWSYLKVLDQSPGWLLVRYEGDGNRLAGEAWVPAGAVGPIGTPRWLTSLRETPLYAGPEPDAPIYTRLPSWSMLEAKGQAGGNRMLVHYAGDGDTRQPGEAWVRVADVDVARAPQGSRLAWGAMAGSADDGTHLMVPYRTQLDGSAASGANCGPASIGMALEAFGVWTSTGELRNLANRLQGIWDPNNGVAIDVLATMVRRYDLRPLDLEAQGGGFRRWSIEDVRRHLRAGHPVIPQVRYRLLPGRGGFPVSYDHYIVITGFDGDTFYYHDPIPSGGRGNDLMMSVSQLVRAWESSDFPRAALAITR